MLTTGGKTFSYDSENHLMSMNSGAVQLLYDGDGNRVAKSVNGVDTATDRADDLNPTGYPQVVRRVERHWHCHTPILTYGLQRISQQQAISEHTWTPELLPAMMAAEACVRWTNNAVPLGSISWSATGTISFNSQTGTWGEESGGTTANNFVASSTEPQWTMAITGASLDASCK